MEGKFSHLDINVMNFYRKFRTYFVEYNFPTSTPVHGQDKDISMATELTRIASKKLQDRGEFYFRLRECLYVIFY